MPELNDGHLQLESRILLLEMELELLGSCMDQMVKLVEMLIKGLEASLENAEN